MSLRHLLETNFPLNTTEVQPSLEGFKDVLNKIFKKKQTPTDNKTHHENQLSTREKYLQFYMDVLSSKDITSLKLIEGEVTLSKIASAYMTRNEKPVQHPVDELNKDVGQYTRILSQIKPTINAYNRFLKVVNKEIDAFERKDKNGTDGFDELVAITDKLNKLAPTPLAKTFKEPGRGVLMGISDPSFTDGEMFSDMVAELHDEVDAITLPALTHDQLKKVKEHLNKLASVKLALWELQDVKDHALDISDQPYRRYSAQFLKDKNIADKANNALFFHEHDHVYFYGILSPLETHTFNLTLAFIEYAYKSVKHDD